MNNGLYQVDFPIDLQEPEKDNTYTFYTTISCILDENSIEEEVFKIQNEILEEIDNDETLGYTIYRYPKNNLHFSVINFPKLSKPLADFNAYKLANTDNSNKIEKIFKKFDGKVIKNNTIDFLYIYTHKSSSLALQAFPSSNLLDFFDELKNAFEKEGLDSVEIKGQPNENPYRFVVNLVKFFDKPSKQVFSILAKRVREINIRSLKQPLIPTQRIKQLTLVYSDNYLNRHKRISSIDIK